MLYEVITVYTGQNTDGVAPGALITDLHCEITRAREVGRRAVEFPGQVEPRADTAQRRCAAGLIDVGDLVECTAPQGSYNFV